VILQSTHDNIVNTRIGGSNRSAMAKWGVIQEIVENKDYRNFYYFRNENHETTYFSEQETKDLLLGRNKEFKNSMKALKVLFFYIDHWKHTLDDKKKIVVLTDTTSKYLSKMRFIELSKN